MPEETEAVRRWRLSIRNPQDFFGGLALVALALFALWASDDLPGMRGFAFGPGTAPRLFAVLLGTTGAAVALLGLVFDGPRLEKFAVRGPVFVVAAILFFAATIRPLGLVIATFFTAAISAGAAKDVRWIETIIVAIVLTVFCAFLFPYALNLPLALWPRF
jgi:putative tricarboxylic transport membrane protein